MGLVDKLTTFMAFCCAVRRNKGGAVMGKLLADVFRHEQWMGLSLPVGHFRMRAFRQVTQRARVETGNQPKIVNEIKGCAMEWGV